jgi:enoyl-CoA hydratase
MERDGATVTLRLAGPRGNAVSSELIRDLGLALDGIEPDPDIQGILLASAHPRIFCPGLDLLEVAPLDRAGMKAFMAGFTALYRRLFAFPKPVVAAVAGHAVAGGCVIALSADHRVLRDEGAMIGLNEVRIGVPFPWGVAVLLRHTARPAVLAQAMMLGRNYAGREAVEAGLAQELAPAGQVEILARERLAEFTSKEPAALAALKGFLRGEAARSMAEGDARHMDDFLDVWFSPSARRLVKNAARSLVDRKR